MTQICGPTWGNLVDPALRALLKIGYVIGIAERPAAKGRLGQRKMLLS